MSVKKGTGSETTKELKKSVEEQQTAAAETGSITDEMILQAAAVVGIYRACGGCRAAAQKEAPITLIGSGRYFSSYKHAAEQSIYKDKCGVRI